MERECHRFNLIGLDCDKPYGKGKRFAYRMDNYMLLELFNVLRFQEQDEPPFGTKKPFNKKELLKEVETLLNKELRARRYYGTAHSKHLNEFVFKYIVNFHKDMSIGYPETKNEPNMAQTIKELDLF